MSELLVNAAADLMIADAVTLASLPPPLAHRIFLALPADARGRASCVCRAWRDILAEPSLWTCLDMSFLRAERQRFESVLRGASGRALGRLSQLDLSQHHVRWRVLRPVLAANAGSLRELHLFAARARNFDASSTAPIVEAVVAAAPLLQALTAEDLSCSGRTRRGCCAQSRRLRRCRCAAVSKCILMTQMSSLAAWTTSARLLKRLLTPHCSRR